MLSRGTTWPSPSTCQWFYGLEPLLRGRLLCNYSELLCIYVAQRFITVFVSAFHHSQSWVIQIQSIPPNSVALRSTLMISIHLSLCIPCGMFSTDFPTNVECAFLCSHACYMPCPFHPPWLHHSNCTWRSVKLMKLVIMQLVQSLGTTNIYK
jgi:hypothetical protein